MNESAIFSYNFKMTYLYFISTERRNVVKIGIANNPNKRLKTFQTANYEKLIILRVIKVANRALAFKLETALHQKFKKYHIRGEWFKLTPTIINFIENYQTDNPSVIEEFILYLQYIIIILGFFLMLLFFFN